MRFLDRRCWLGVGGRVRVATFGMVETGEKEPEAGRIGCWRESVAEVVL